MKNLLVLLLLLTACSPSKNSLTFSDQNLSVPAESSSSSSYSFGSAIIENASVADKTFTFSRASGAGEAAGSEVSLSNTVDFALVSATGCNRELVKTSDLCYVKVRLLKKTAGNYSATLQVGSAGNYNVISISATVIPDPASSAISLREGTTVLTSLDFGPVDKNTKTIKTLGITNDSTATLTLSVSATNAYAVTTNNCAATLAAKKTCYIKVTFTAGPGLEVDETKTGTLNIASGISFAITGLVRGTPAIPPGSPLIKYYDNSVQTETLNFGDLAYNKTVSRVIVVKNEGTASGVIPALSLTNGYTLTANTCSSTTLKVGSTCQLRIQLVSNTPGSITSSVNILGSILAIQANVTAPLAFNPTSLGDIDSLSVHALQITGGVPPYSVSVSSSISSYYDNSIESISAGNNLTNNMVQESVSVTDNVGQHISLTYRVKKGTPPVAVPKAIEIYYSDYVRIYSDDEEINCGMGEGDCYIQWPDNAPSTFTLHYELDPSAIISSAVYAAYDQYWMNTHYQDLTTTPVDPIVLDLANNGYYHIINFSAQPDPRGRVTVQYPDHGRIYTNDSAINCGNGNYSCDYTYPVDTTSLTVYFADITPGYRLSSFQNVGNDYGNYGTSSPFTVNIASGNAYLVASTQLIPAYELVIKIRGGDVSETLNWVSGDLNGTCEGLCAQKIPGGEMVTITPQTNGSGLEFIRWVSCPNVVGNQCSFSLDQATEVIGEFESRYTLTKVTTRDPNEANHIGYSAQDGNDLLFADLSTSQLRRFNFDTNAKVDIKSFPSYNPPGFLFKLGSKMIYQGGDGEIFSVEGNGFTSIFTPATCPAQFSYGGNMIRQGGKYLMVCYDPNSSPNHGYIYLVDVVAQTSSLVYEADSQDYNFTVMSYDFLTGEMILNRVNGVSVIERINNLGIVTQSINAPANTQTNGFTKGNGYLYAWFQNRLYQIPDSLSAGYTNMADSNGQVYLDNDKLYNTSSNYRTLRRLSSPHNGQALQPLYLGANVGDNCHYWMYMYDQLGSLKAFNCWAGGHGQKANMYVPDPNSLHTNFEVNKISALPFNSGGAYYASGFYTVGQHSYILTTSMYSPENNAIVLRLDSGNPRFTRQFFQVDHADIIPFPPELWYESAYINPRAMFVLDNGRIIIETQRRDNSDLNDTPVISYDRYILTP